MMVKVRYTNPDLEQEWRDFTLKVLDNNRIADSASIDLTSLRVFIYRFYSMSKVTSTSSPFKK